MMVGTLSLVPLPPPGSVTLSFNVAGRGITATPPRHPDLPVADCPLRNLLLLFNPRELLTIVACLLSEQRIVVTSARVALLTPVLEGFFW